MKIATGTEWRYWPALTRFKAARLTFGLIRYIWWAEKDSNLRCFICNGFTVRRFRRLSHLPINGALGEIRTLTVWFLGPTSPTNWTTSAYQSEYCELALTRVDTFLYWVRYPVICPVTDLFVLLETTMLVYVNHLLCVSYWNLRYKWKYITYQLLEKRYETKYIN